MPSRQDQLHSYQFAVRRVVAALVTRETDPARAPFARTGGALLAGLLVAAIAAGAVVVLDLLTGGGATSWRDASVVVVEKETGARYVYRDERLHPVVNYASALLVAGSAETVLVSRRSIEDVPRGVPLGIVDAPDSLPPAGRLAGTSWALCSSEAAPILLAGPSSAGPSLDGGTALGEAGALVAAGGETYLLWHDRRHPVGAADALGWGTAGPVAVDPALLNAVPLGAALAAPAVPGFGGPSFALPGAVAGQVYVVATQGGARDYAVALVDGLAAITQVQADILLGDPRNGQQRPVELSQSAYAAAPRAGDLRPADGPAVTPALVPVEGPLCGVVASDAGVSGLRVGARVPSADGFASAAVRIGPGSGALVEAVPAPGAPGGTISLVTAGGRRHALASTEVKTMLGYADATPARLPAAVVELIPEGAALDPAAAARPALP